MVRKNTVTAHMYQRELPEVGIGDRNFILVKLFNNEDQVLGRIIQTVHSSKNMPDAKQESRFEEDSSYFLVCIWLFLEDRSGTNQLNNDERLVVGNIWQATLKGKQLWFGLK